MKLATLRDGSRDGQLIVVSRDLSTAHLAHHIAPTLQRAIDDWSFMAPQLEDLYEALNQHKARHSFSFDTQDCLAPLPRAYAHYQLQETTLCAAPSDQCVSGTEPIRFLDDAAPKSWTPVLAAITDHIVIAAGPKECATRALLMMMALQWMPTEASSRQSSIWSFAPVTVTPDELGQWPSDVANTKSVWKSRRNEEAAVPLIAPNDFGNFATALSLGARGRALQAGSIVSMSLTANDALMMIGDRLRIDLRLDNKHSVFGEIDQTVTALKR